jgi:hypothetical protein
MSRCIHKLCVFNHVTTRMIRTLFCHRKLASLELHLNRLYEDKSYLTEKMAVRCRFGAAAEWLRFHAILCSWSNPLVGRVTRFSHECRGERSRRRLELSFFCRKSGTRKLSKSKREPVLARS